MPQLALDNVDRNPLTGEFDGVGVAELVGGEPLASASADLAPAQPGQAGAGPAVRAKHEHPPRTEGACATSEAGDPYADPSVRGGLIVARSARRGP